METTSLIGKNFNTAIFDMDGNLVYPTDKKKIKSITRILKSVVKNNVSFDEEEQKWYATSGEIVTINGSRFQIVTTYDVTELIDEISHASFDETTLEVGEDDTKCHIKPGTMSVGINYISWEELNTMYEKGFSVEEIRTNILNKCDAALYVSKNTGKNKVTSVNRGPIIKLV